MLFRWQMDTVPVMIDDIDTGTKQSTNRVI